MMNADARSWIYSGAIAAPYEPDAANRFCSDCREPWHECSCDLPTYEEVANDPICQRRTQIKAGDVQ